MRVFGIGLGLKGIEYTLCRKLLMKNLSGDSSWRFTKPDNGEACQRRERVQRDVISVRFTPDTLGKLAELFTEKHISRNMLIENIVEDYVRAAFPALNTLETAAEELPAAPTETAPETE